VTAVATVIVRCPACSAKNRIDRAKAAASRPRCAHCREYLEVPSPQTDPLVVTDANFNETVAQSPLRALLEFWSPTCGYSKRFEPVLRRATPEISEHLRVGRVNIAEERGLAGRYRVSATPTLLVLDGTKEIDRVEGAMDYDALKYRLHRYLSG
jgi:thioredoxin 2